MRFFKNSNDEKKTALTMHDRATDTPRPLYILRWNGWMATGGTFWPLVYMSESRWYCDLAESMGSVAECC